MKGHLIRLCSFLVLSLAISSAAQAQATRTWVSGVGDDANPCSRTAPCKTFAGAISKTATGGEINTLDPGGFGALTITKSITINGGDFTSGVLVSGTNGFVVNAGNTSNVILRNLVIDGLGTSLDGVLVSSAKHVHIEKCVIRGFQNGVHNSATPSTGAGGGAVTVQDSTITDNTTGLLGDNASLMHGENVALVNNVTGVQAHAGATIGLSNTSIYDNDTEISCTTGGSVATAGNNRFGITTGGSTLGGGLTLGSPSSGPAGPGCGNFKKVIVK